MNPRLSAQGLQVAYHRVPVLQSLDIAIPPGKVSVICGANASGKSTLLKALARLLPPRQGRVVLDGRPLEAWPGKQRARILGMLPQTPVVPEGITVADLVGRGRYPWQTFLGQWSREDHRAVEEAMAAMDVQDLADRDIGELSGGQRQRVWIAMALAQETDILLLDEPTTYLDLAHQVEILDRLEDLNQRRGTTIVMVLHELNLAIRYAHWIFAMKDGHLHAQGEPTALVNPGLIREVFSLDCLVVPDPWTGKPMVVPQGKNRFSH